MARLIQAIAKYRPRVKRSRTAGPEELVAHLARGNAWLSPAVIRSIVEAIGPAVEELNLAGTAVKVPGLGTFGTTLDRHGRVSVTYYQDSKLRQRLNQNRGRLPVIHRRRIGFTDAQYAALWDADHPDDPVEGSP